MESSEEETDWEQIQHPSSPPPQGAPLEFDLVIRDNFFADNSSIFPPSEHEDLSLLEGEDCCSPSIIMSSRSPLPSTCSDKSTPKEQQIKKASHSRLSAMINEIGTRMCTIGRKVFQVIPCSYSRKCPLIPASALAVVALFACVRILQWRNRLLLLMRERDQRISHLMHQITHLNEILSARRKVPVLRV